MGPHLQTVNVVVEQGLTAITWCSLNISTYVESVRKALKQLQLILSRASEIFEHRICHSLQSMSDVSLCKLPDGEQWTIHTLVARTEVGARAMSIELVEVLFDGLNLSPVRVVVSCVSCLIAQYCITDWLAQRLW